MSKKSRPWTRQQRASMRQRALLGKWTYYCRWYLFSDASRRENAMCVAPQTKLTADLNRRTRCPVCHKKPLECVHLPIDVYTELAEHIVGPTRMQPWPFQHAGRWPLS